jgi:hypothetical protein
LNSSQNVIPHKSVLSNSNIFDSENLKQQIETLTNEKNSFIRKIESLTKEAMKGDNLL